MKKGLLSLLALALTVVGCQNYDDQFDELTSQITSLQSTVDGLTGVTAAITQLQSSVAAINSAVTGLSNYDDSGIVAQLNAVSSTLADLLAQLDGVATNADLAAISDTLADVQADVRELLEGNSTINQNLTINSEATLQYAETLVSTGTDRPNVIVNGTVTINTTNFSADQQTRANEIAKKIATVLQDVSVTSTSVVDFESMTFVDANLTLNGGGADITEARTITGDFQSTEIGAVDYSYLSSVGGSLKVIAGDAGATNVNSITSVNFGTATFGSISVGLAATPAHTINAPKAGSIVTGNSPVLNVIGTSASNIDHNYTGDTALASLTIVAQPNSNDGTVDVLATKITGNITITGTKTLIVKLSALTTDNNYTVSTQVGQLHLNKVKNASGGINAVVTALPEFLAQSAAASISSTNPNLPKADSTTGTGVLTLTGTGAATIKNTDAALVADDITSLTVSALEGDVTFPAAMAELSTLNITAKVDTPVVPSTQDNDVVVSNLASLTILSVDGAYKSVTSVNNAKLASLTTAGGIVELVVTGAAKLASASIGHDHINGNDAATLDFQGTILPSLDLSSVSKVSTLTVTNNSKLESLTAPSTTVLAEAGATVNVTIGVNSMTAVWEQYQPGIAATGTTPAIPAVPAKLKSNGLVSIQTLLNAYKNTQTASPTFSIDTFVVSGTTTYGTFQLATAADAYSSTGSGTIDDYTELAVISAE